jgi:hypothetical protein
MPNYCWNTVTVTGPAADISAIREAEFSFRTLAPAAEATPEAQAAAWGTERDRYEYTVKAQGVQGLRVTFTTAWMPPIKFLKTLLEQRPGLWIKAEWTTEDGDAGVWLGHVPEGDVPETKELRWDEGCLEENAHLFRREA